MHNRQWRATTSLLREYENEIANLRLRTTKVWGQSQRVEKAHYVEVKGIASNMMVPRGGIEPPTPAFSVQCSTN
jgi:hypothetical protein